MTERLLTSRLWLVENSIEGAEISHGWDENIRDQIPIKSRQSHILAATEKDATVRFIDRETLEAWDAAKKPDAYSLSFNGDLAGIIWHRPEVFPLDPDNPTMPAHTFAIRLYKPYEGRSLSYPFMDACLKDYIHLSYERGQMDNFGVWLTTGGGERMVNFYRRYGYEPIGETDKAEPVMVLSEGKIREILGA